LPTAFAQAGKFLVVIALSLATTPARAAGFRFIEVPADADGPALNGAIWYPCSEPPREMDLGNIAISGVRDCTIRGDKLHSSSFRTAEAATSSAITISPRRLPMPALSSPPSNHPGSTTLAMRPCSRFFVPRAPDAPMAAE
jgi:hypothetical protein